MTGDTAQWVTLATVISGFIYQEVRVTRQRKWDKEDRAELAAHLKDTRADLAEKVETAAVTATARMVDESAKLADAIEANTQISTKAFHEANGAKELIAAEVTKRNEIQASTDARLKLAEDAK